MHRKEEMNIPTIIILNGPSGVGKSTLQKEFQKLMCNQVYLSIGIDGFFDQLLPDVNCKGEHVVGGQLVRKITFEQDEVGNVTIPLTVGPLGYVVVRGMHRAVAAYAREGNSIIVDYILYHPQWLSDLVYSLSEIDAHIYMVGVNAPLEVIEQRERSRGTSPVGHSRSHYQVVHAGMLYDLELDTSEYVASDLALQLKKYIDTYRPVAFKSLLPAVRTT